MLIAKQKRNENIAEYILYLWQMEDLLRALAFDSDKIYRTLVEPLSVDVPKKQEVFFWYTSIINLLKEEKKDKVGHTFHSLHLIRDLNDVHLYLLKKDEKYPMLYTNAKDDIEAFRDKSQQSANTSDIEVAFNALYSKLLLSLKKETITNESEEAFLRIAKLIAYLSNKYLKIESGEEAYNPD